jgi:hypothetical protein
MKNRVVKTQQNALVMIASISKKKGCHTVRYMRALMAIADAIIITRLIKQLLRNALLVHIER